jgi:hypothetical protein
MKERELFKDMEAAAKLSNEKQLKRLQSQLETAREN